LENACKRARFDGWLAGMRRRLFSRQRVFGRRGPICDLPTWRFGGKTALRRRDLAFSPETAGRAAAKKAHFPRIEPSARCTSGVFQENARKQAATTGNLPKTAGLRGEN
jgi:hypothetical protein